MSDAIFEIIILIGILLLAIFWIIVAWVLDQTNK